MRSHKIIEHTADVRFLVEGDTLEELFTAALEALATALSAEKHKNSPAELITVTSKNRTTLIIDFLSEVLTRSHINKKIYTGVRFEEIGETGLRARISGFKSGGFMRDVKAVTNHEASIKKNKKGHLETIIIFDI